MSNLQIFEQRDVLGKDFKIYGDFENPLFLAVNVAEWIDYDTSSVNKLVGLVDESEKLNGTIFWSGQNREMWFVTEDGLMEILFQSRKPIAKEFKTEVKKILRTIRKNGMYATDQLLDNPDFAIEVFRKLKAEREANRNLQIENDHNKQIIKELQPRATYCDLVLQNNSLISITKIAKDYGMSGKALNDILHELGVQYKQGSIWLLYQKHSDKGYTQSKTHVIDPDKSSIHTYWTQKGRMFIYELLKREKNILPLIEREEIQAV